MNRLIAINHVANELEGSTVTHDPEGTRYGVVQSEYNAARQAWRVPSQDISLITYQEASDILTDNYWIHCFCYQLNHPVDFAVFQLVVNRGNYGGGEIVHAALNDPNLANDTPPMGPRVVASINSRDPLAITTAILQAQKAHYLSNGNQDSKGEVNRVILTAQICGVTIS